MDLARNADESSVTDQDEADQPESEDELVLEAPDETTADTLDFTPIIDPDSEDKQDRYRLRAAADFQVTPSSRKRIVSAD
jgi:hypothetical protein